MDDSRDISNVLQINNRELLALIVLAHYQNHIYKTNRWRIGYDPNASEPNDGLITNGKNRIDIEHKYTTHWNKEDSLDAILKTYDKNAAKGEAYGKGRTLIIHANKASPHLIKISTLRDQIQNKSPFDRVLLLSFVSYNFPFIMIHMTEHFPSQIGIVGIELNTLSGKAKIFTS